MSMACGCCYCHCRRQRTVKYASITLHSVPLYFACKRERSEREREKKKKKWRRRKGKTSKWIKKQVSNQIQTSKTIYRGLPFFFFFFFLFWRMRIGGRRSRYESKVLLLELQTKPDSFNCCSLKNRTECFLDFDSTMATRTDRVEWLWEEWRMDCIPSDADAWRVNWNFSFEFRWRFFRFVSFLFSSPFCRLVGRIDCVCVCVFLSPFQWPSWFSIELSKHLCACEQS